MAKARFSTVIPYQCVFVVFVLTLLTMRAEVGSLGAMLEPILHRLTLPTQSQPTVFYAQNSPDF